MRFQGSGFSVELDADVMDVSGYAFNYPKLGALPPSISLRFEPGAKADMAERASQVVEQRVPSLPNANLRAAPQAQRRGDWEYFTFVVEFGGEDDARLVQKEIQIRVTQPNPTVYVITGTDQLANFPRFEPTYDAFVRSFQPNDVQRLNG